MTRVLAAALLIAGTLTPAEAGHLIPVASSDRTYTTTLFLENSTSAERRCTVNNGAASESFRIAPNSLRIDYRFLSNLNGAALVRTDCDGVIVHTRIHRSRDGGRTFDRGRLFAALSGAPARVHRLAPAADLVVGEVTGQPVEVRLMIRHASDLTDDAVLAIPANGIHLISIGPRASADVAVSIEVVSGSGSITVGEAITDEPIRQRFETAERLASSGGVQSTHPLTRLLVASSFKAAPFHDPATGLVYMRERWYDPRTGTFLTPDPMGFLDSSNTYAYGAGDPVNNSDPTGLALYAFDGTANTPEDRTNVFKLSSAYIDGAGAFYREGVGTNWYSVGWGRVTGLGGKRRVNQMYDVFRKIYQVDKSIDIIGFSRGAAQALDFANKIYREGVYDEKLRTRVIPKIRFLGVFDTVGSFGVPGDDDNRNYTLTVPPNVERARHAIAQDEYRSAFPLNRLWNDYGCGANLKIVEKHFPGSHSDVGGGYKNDYLSRVPLQWMLQEMQVAGIKMDSIPQALGSIPSSVTPEAHESHRSLIYVHDWMRVTKNRSWGITPGRQFYLPECQ